MIAKDPLHWEKVEICWVIPGRRIISPICLEGNVDTTEYLHIFLTVCWRAGQRGSHARLPPARRGTRPHVKIIHGNHPEFLEDRLISKDLWPPRSPDLPPPVLFLWGCLKERVFRYKRHTTNALKENITNEMRQIENRTMKHTTDSMQRRIQICLITGHWSLVTSITLCDVTLLMSLINITRNHIFSASFWSTA